MSFGKYHTNAYIEQHPMVICWLKRCQAGTNQYGKPTETLWFGGDYGRSCMILIQHVHFRGIYGQF